MSSNTLYNKLFAPNRQVVNAYTGREYLDERYFLLTILAAFFLHVLGMYIWHMVPSMPVVDIPVRVLNIKLGDGETLTPEELKAVQPNADNQNNVETAISKIAHDQDPATQERTKAVVGTMDKAMNVPDQNSVSKAFEKALAGQGNDAAALVEESADKLSTIAKQFVRTNNVQAGKGEGTAIGNSSEKDAEMMSRYEQMISLWIEKFKLYPTEARAQGMQGETIVRIRIDRQGNIRYYILERSTGFQLLDRAAIDMVKRANPVPAVPHDYPPGDLIEFLIPVNFRLQ